MALAYKSRLRYRKFDEYPRVNALPLIIPSTFREVKSSQMKTKMRADLGVKEKVGQKEKERMDFRFVRVNDRLFKVKSHRLPLRTRTHEVSGSARVLLANATEDATRYQVLRWWGANA